ncbi:MAG TPA: hypothetical protein VIM29_02535 [Bacillota bacterium]
MNESLIYLVTLLAGLGFQFLFRWSVTKNLWLSFLILVAFSPSISFGLVCGLWVGCAFIPDSLNRKRLPNNYQIGWKDALVFSIWTFAGFLLTLVYLFKIKLTGNMEIVQSEALAWVFLTMIELCLFRIVADSVPDWSRGLLGCRMGLINFLMVLYWIYRYGWLVMGLIFISLIVAFQLLLSLMKFPTNRTNDVVRGGR